jgi:hypothetical protein
MGAPPGTQHLYTVLTWVLTWLLRGPESHLHLAPHLMPEEGLEPPTRGL